MKNRILLSAFLLLLSAGEVLAQSRPEKKLRFGVSAEGGKFLGEFGGNYKPGLGGNAVLDYAIDPDLRLTFSGGFIHFPGKSFEDRYLVYKIDDWKALPFRIGGKYFVSRHFFLKAETGAVFFLEPGSGTSFILSPGMGLHFRGFEIAAKLETWTDGGTISYGGLNLAYFF